MSHIDTTFNPNPRNITGHTTFNSLNSFRNRTLRQVKYPFLFLFIEIPYKDKIVMEYMF